MLLDERRETIDSSNTGQTGLLLHNGQTVCDDHFNSKIIDIICQEMGYSGAISGMIGLGFDIRYNYDIGMDQVNCTDSDTWESCTHEEDHDCDHSEDVYLTCRTPTSTSGKFTPTIN